MIDLSHIQPIISDGMLFSWASQAEQYPTIGPVGLAYFRGEVPELQQHVDCLLYRRRQAGPDQGHLIGILNHYPFDNDFEQKGNINIWIHPRHQRSGIASRLLRAAHDRWEIDPRQQRYTEAGLAFARSFYS